MIVRFKFPKNLKKELYKGLQDSKRVSKTYSIHSGILYIDCCDLEEVEKIFDRLVLNYSIL